MNPRTRELLMKLPMVCDRDGYESAEFKELLIELTEIITSDEKELEEVKRYYDTLSKMVLGIWEKGKGEQ